MSEWKEVELGEVCDLLDCLHKTPKYSEEGYPMVRVTDVKNGFLDSSDCLLVNKEVFTAFSKGYKPKVGDIVFTRVGSFGLSAIVKEEEEFCIGQNTTLLIPKTIDPFFIFYYLIGQDARFQIEGLAGGSTQPTISMATIRKIVVPYPSVTEQRTIAAVLSSLDNKIDLLHRQNKTLEQMAETLFRQWFVEEADDGWEEGPLGDVIDIFDNKRIPLSKMRRNKMKEGKLYPYYGAASVMDFVNDYIFDGEYILLGEDGTVRTDEGYPILQYATGKFWVNNHTHIIQAKAPYNNFFIWNYLSRKNIDRIVTGAVQPKINQTNLKSLEFPIYPNKLIDEFIEITNSQFEKMNKNKSQIRALEKMRDTLLPKLMSGEVKVSIDG